MSIDIKPKTVYNIIVRRKRITITGQAEKGKQNGRYGKQNSCKINRMAQKTWTLRQ